MTRTAKAGSQQWTAVSLLLELVSTVQRRYVTPAKELTHINCKMTRSLYQVQFRTLNSLALRNTPRLPHNVFEGARNQSVTIGVAKSKNKKTTKNNNKCGWTKPAKPFNSMASTMLIRSLVDPTLAVFVVCSPLQLFSLVKLLRFGVPTRQILTAPPQLRL